MKGAAPTLRYKAQATGDSAPRLRLRSFSLGLVVAERNPFGAGRGAPSADMTCWPMIISFIMRLD